MNLHKYSVLVFAITGVLALVVASPALSKLLIFPQTDFFTEFWVLGSNHAADYYPSSISRNHSYSVFLGIGNRLGYCAYYTVQVKLRNQTEPAPINNTSSSLPALYNINAFVADNTAWEIPVSFSFDYTYHNETSVYNETRSWISFRNLTLNNIVLDIGNYITYYDSNRQGFYENLFFELWIFNRTLDDFQYHARFLNLRLNMTVV